MTDEEVNEAIARDLYVNQFEWNREESFAYDRTDRAEYMDRILYMCPKCRSFNTLHSHGDILGCTSCGSSMTVDERCRFVGPDAVFDNMYDWDVWQTGELEPYVESCVSQGRDIITMEGIGLSRIEDDGLVPLASGAVLVMDRNGVTISAGKAEYSFPLDDIVAMTPSITCTFIINCGGQLFNVTADDHSSIQLPQQILRILKVHQ